MDKETVVQKISKALTILYRTDRDLIKNKTNEETIVSHLVGYLRPDFLSEGWNVDPGYNRDEKDPKKDSSGNLILPDIIIHHRTPAREERFSSENNLAAIEVKGFWNAEDRNIDSQKLHDMKNRYGYQYLFRIELKEDTWQLIEKDL